MCSSFDRTWGEYVFLWACYWCLYFGGTNPLYFLNKVAQDGGGGEWSMLGGVGEGKARPSRVTTRKNGF